MTSFNTLLPDLGTDFRTVYDFIVGNATPVCMYTYSTCIASSSKQFYIEYSGDTSYECCNIISEEVTYLYGRGRMDNKITLEYDYKGIRLYITYWDNRISISNGVTFLNDVRGVNQYRVVPYVVLDDEDRGWVTIPSAFYSVEPGVTSLENFKSMSNAN